MDNNLQWIQVNFDTPIKATAVLTQGGTGWVKSYQISYSVDGISWALYKDKQGKDKVRKMKDYQNFDSVIFLVGIANF